jgi:hypothetical protein
LKCCHKKCFQNISKSKQFNEFNRFWIFIHFCHQILYKKFILIDNYYYSLCDWEKQSIKLSGLLIKTESKTKSNHSLKERNFFYRNIFSILMEKNLKFVNNF